MNGCEQVNGTCTVKCLELSTRREKVLYKYSPFPVYRHLAWIQGSSAITFGDFLCHQAVGIQGQLDYFQTTVLVSVHSPFELCGNLGFLATESGIMLFASVITPVLVL